MAREFLTINGINVEPTEDNIVTVTKNILKDFTSKEAESLKSRIEKATCTAELPNSFFLEDNCLVFIDYSKDAFMINIDGKNGGQVVYLRELA